MKKVFLLLLLVSGVAEAANIKKGNWEVSGSIAYSHYSDNDYFSVSPAAQYFFMDYFSFGLKSTYSAGSNAVTVYSLGPVASLYFPVSDSVAPYISVAPLVWSRYASSGRSYYRADVDVGVKFFLTDSVAFGPVVSWNHYYPSNGGKSSNGIDVMGVFSIHL